MGECEMRKGTNTIRTYGEAMSKRDTAILACLAVCGLLMSATMAEETYVQTVKVPDGASMDEIVELSTRIVPHPRQMIWHKDEFIAFIHYGPNAFSRREWGSGSEDPSLFNPTDLDTDQWCDVMKKAEIKRVVLTVKHHDGMCLWQSRYTKHGVNSSKWRDGEGDVLRDLAESCKKYGLKLGVYLSPADLHEIKDGNRYGNLSKYREEVIPTPVEGRPFADKRTFRYSVDDYNRYFMNQLSELLTEYGPIYETWFDGAHPKRKGGQTYTRTQWTELIHTLAPDAMLAVKGPDTRWCGNESGGTRPTEFNVIPLYVEKYEDEQWNDRRGGDLGSRAKLKDAKWLHYYPAEVNTSIRHGWFYRDDEHQTVRDADNVFDIYERAVGGNAAFLLNIPPNREGKYSPRDVESLLETGRRIRATYHTSVSEGSKGPAEVLDGKDETFWQPEDQTGDFEVTLKGKAKINRFMLQEAIATRGQRVEAHALDAWVDGAWKEVAAATSIGYKRILRFPIVETDRFRIRITGSRANPTICRASAHYYDEPPNPVEVRVNRNNRVTLVAGIAAFSSKAGFRANNAQLIYYTTDGSEPMVASMLYTAAFDMPEGGTIKARTIVGDRKGTVRTRVLGYPTQKWKILSFSGDRDPRRSPAARAIDGTSHHGWMSKAGDGEKHFAVDMQEEHSIAGFAYLPPNPGRKPVGLVEKYRLEVSADGKTWTAVKEGQFGNIVNDPSKRTVRFDKPVKARYFKLVGVSSAAGSKEMGIQEFEVLGK
jgi:alpha-L-fucosidase